MAKAYLTSYKLPVITTRGNNVRSPATESFQAHLFLGGIHSKYSDDKPLIFAQVYGPQQFPEKLIPKFALLASRGQPLPIHGDGKPGCSETPLCAQALSALRISVESSKQALHVANARGCKVEGMIRRRRRHSELSVCQGCGRRL